MKGGRKGQRWRMNTALHSQRPWRPPPCLSTCTSPPPTLLSSFIPRSLYIFYSPLHIPPLLASPLRLSSLPLSLSSPPHQLSSSFLPFHTSLPILHLWSFLHICLCDQKTTTASFSLNLSSPAFSYPVVLNICRMQIKSSRMTRWIRSSFPSRITGCSNSKGGSDILFLSVVYSPSLIHTHQVLKLFPSGAQAASVSLSITALTAFRLLFIYFPIEE